jgi:hypothetical protein
MSVIFDYEPESNHEWTQFKLVCPKCGNDRFSPFPSLHRHCLRVCCGLCAQDIMRPRLQSEDLSGCGDCGLQAECLGLPTFKIYDYLVHG